MIFVDFGGGVCGVPRRTRQREIRLKPQEKTIPALAFVIPYHEMLMRELLRVGEFFGVKTRSSNWNYRGLVLLYTSHGHHHEVPCRAYKFDPEQLHKGVIVGVATLVDSRKLTWQEKICITQNFNKVDPNTAEEMLLGTDGYYITPLPYGVFLQDVKRFKKPIPFKPRPGAIGIMRVSTKLVARALKEVGINPKSYS